MKNKSIIYISKKVIDDEITNKILSVSKHKNIKINMKNVETINSKIFIEKLLSNKFKLFNLKNEILIYLSLILKDGFLKAYMSEWDCRENKRELIRRNFLTV